MQRILLFLLPIGLSFVLSGCSTEKTSTESKEKELTEIELKQQIDGVFLGFIGDATVKIEHDGEESVFLINGKVTGDLDIVKEGDNIVLSTKEVNGSLVLETLRLK